LERFDLETAKSFLPLLWSMGVDATVTLERPGFMQAGGGVLTAEIGPIKRWKKLKLTERGEPVETFGLVLHAHLPGEIAKREIVTASKILEWPENHIGLRYANDSAGPGNALLLGARFANVCEISSGIAQLGKSAEAVATGAAKGLRGYLASTAPVGAHLADQLLLSMALAGGGVFHTLSITDHTRTNMALIEQFLPVKFGVEEMGSGIKEVLCN
jgi:RNA 3'-terminal phosphate cyclase (ATP)